MRRREDASNLARVLAAELRRQCGISKDAPLSFHGLQRLARARGIATIHFNARIASEGSIEAGADGTFHVLIARPPSARGRYSLAHEIAHTYFLEMNVRNARPTVFSSTDILASLQKLEDEEGFCEVFASELLLPSDTAKSELEALPDARSSTDFIRRLEGLSRRYSVSLRMLLIKAYSVRCWPAALLVGVLDVLSHGKRRLGDELRVLAAYSSPTSGWYMPNNQSAATAGFQRATLLADAWIRTSDSLESVSDSVGVFQIDETSRLRRLSDVTTDIGPTMECLQLKRREPAGKWSRHQVSLPVEYRLYASSYSEAYVLAIAQLNVPSASRHTAL
jgi:hypothetical protein